jgi:hypothetical protein
VPDGAIRAGHDKDSGPLFVGRAFYETDVLPAKIVPNHRAAYVSFAGQEHQVTQYEVSDCTVLRPSAETDWLAFLFHSRKVPCSEFSPKTLYSGLSLLFCVKVSPGEFR